MFVNMKRMHSLYRLILTSLFEFQCILCIKLYVLMDAVVSYCSVHGWRLTVLVKCLDVTWVSCGDERHSFIWQCFLRVLLFRMY